MKRCERRRFIKRRRRAEKRRRIWATIKTIIFPWPYLAYIARRNRAVFASAFGLILFVTIASLYPGYSAELSSLVNQDHDNPGKNESTSPKHSLQSISTLQKLAQDSVTVSRETDDSESEPDSSEISDPVEDPPNTSPPDESPPEVDPPDTGTPDNSVRVAEVIFTDEKGNDDIPEGKTSFSVTSTYSVYICSTWENTKGSHDKVIEVYCPDGELYQTIYVPFTTHSLPSMTKTVPWSPRPVEIELVSMTNGVYPVWAELPIAGTWAMRLKGTWSVKIYLDDNDTCLAHSSFILNP